MDLAAQPKTTAAVLIAWVDGKARIEQVICGLTDGDLRALGTECSGPFDRVGLDCPLGWPTAFTDLLASHALGEHNPIWSKPVREATAELRYRSTDTVVWKRVGRPPISVSTDKLGSTALRAARLIQLWESDRGEHLARDGSGWLVEVYPAAARACWQLNTAERDLPELTRHVPGLEITGAQGAVIAGNEHIFDALVAAFVARAAQLSRTVHPGRENRDVALTEGWIHLPEASSVLESLSDAPQQTTE